jgi:hypothetical protein
MKAAAKSWRGEGQKVTISQTIGFVEEISEDVRARVFWFAMRNISVKRDFIVFSPEPVSTHIEDQGRTIVTHIDGLTKTCYAKLDDFQEPSTWNEIYEKSTVADLKKSGIGRFILTFMLAEEY